MVAWCGAVLGELHATFVDSKPGGDHALPLVALLVAQPLALLVALLSVVRTKRVQLPNTRRRLAWWLVVGVLKWRGTARRVAVPSLGFCCVVAVSYSPTTYRLQYHWRCRA